HPYYAGAYAHGRRRTDPKRKRPGHSGSGRVVVPLSEWAVFLPDRLPAYISWERYLANQQRLQRNQSRPTSPGTPRAGRCLLSGLVRCGQCGGRMQATYPHATQSAYVCNRAYRQGTSPACPQVPAAVLDALVTEQVLHALEPAALQLSLHALADVAQERQRLDRHWQQQLERARYDTQQAERRYQLVDPANRLVANTLEQRWEEALRAQQQLEEEYARFVQQQPVELTEREQQRLLALAQDIPALWHAADTTLPQRKEIVRCLVESVTATVLEQSEQGRVTIQWAGGCVSEHAVQRPVGCYQQLSNYAALEQRILELRAAGHSAVEIAATLNAEGWRPPKRCATFRKHTVLQWLSRQGHSGPPPVAQLRHGEWRLKDLAAKLEMELPTLRLWRRRGWLHGRRVAATGSWIVWADASELRRLRQLLEYGRQHPSAAYPEELLILKQRKAK
ncbi:MAG TPA: recombinase zinc beta ribbon domain-containing protein, partial [Gemmataceae bacterium]|nr:recombinase zinc beta ribbon domain-containing protein [Gemmataceae bacterium]